MQEQPKRIAKVDWEKFELELHEPKTWVQFLSQYRGLDLAIVSIVTIAITFILTTRSESLSVPLGAIGSIFIFGLAGLIFRKRENDVPSDARPSKNKTKSGYARGD